VTSVDRENAPQSRLWPLSWHGILPPVVTRTAARTEYQLLLMKASDRGRNVNIGKHFWLCFDEFILLITTFKFDFFCSQTTIIQLHIDYDDNDDKVILCTNNRVLWPRCEQRQATITQITSCHHNLVHQDSLLWSLKLCRCRTSSMELFGGTTSRWPIPNVILSSSQDRTVSQSIWSSPQSFSALMTVFYRYSGRTQFYRMNEWMMDGWMEWIHK